MPNTPDRGPRYVPNVNRFQGIGEWKKNANKYGAKAQTKMTSLGGVKWVIKWGTILGLIEGTIVAVTSSLRLL